MESVCIFFFVCEVVVLFLQEDPVLLVPEGKDQKPYVAIVKVSSLLCSTTDTFEKSVYVSETDTDT